MCVYLCKKKQAVYVVRLRKNGRNIVDQQLPTLLDVTCCVRLFTLLRVVGCWCVLLRKVWNQSNFRPVHTDATLLAYNSQHCWELLRPFARSLSISAGNKERNTLVIKIIIIINVNNNNNNNNNNFCAYFELVNLKASISSTLRLN